MVSYLVHTRAQLKSSIDLAQDIDIKDYNIDIVSIELSNDFWKNQRDILNDS